LALGQDQDDAAFRLLGYCETESSLAMHGVMQFARVC
jgi:hypothetical protein